MIGPALRLAAATAAGRAIKDAAVEARNAATAASHRLLLTMAAGVAGAVGVFCLSRAALELLYRYMDPAEAWNVVGGVYGLVGCALYFASTRRAGPGAK